MSWVGDAVGWVGDKVRIIVDAVLGPVSRVVGCIGGVIGGGAVETLYAGISLVARAPPVALSKRAQDVFRNFFPDVQLEKVRIHQTGVLGGRRAITLGHDIHINGTYDECDVAMMIVLMHELVHVQQYESKGWLGFMCDYGSEWLDRGYELSQTELRATRFVNANRSRLKELVSEACQLPFEGRRRNRGLSDAFWTLWGTTR